MPGSEHAVSARLTMSVTVQTAQMPTSQRGLPGSAKASVKRDTPMMSGYVTPAMQGQNGPTTHSNRVPLPCRLRSGNTPEAVYQEKGKAR